MEFHNQIERQANEVKAESSWKWLTIDLKSETESLLVADQVTSTQH